MIPLDLPNASRVEGALYDAADPRMLTDGMVHISVGPYSIDVSWYPEHDPAGHYVITVYEDSWEDQPISPISLSDPSDVVDCVRGLVESLSRPWQPLADSISSYGKFTVTC